MINWFKSFFSNNHTLNTSIHQDTKKLVKEVVTIKGIKSNLRKYNGKKLYQFKDLLDMPHKRYNSCTRFSTEFNMRLDSDILTKSLNDALDYANKGNFTKVITILQLLSEHTRMLIDVEASYRLASCVYFWKDEDLDDYDFEIGDEKIQIFKEIGFESFFLTEPMNSFLPAMDLSQDDLRGSFQYQKELKSLLLRQLKSQKGSDTATT